jgi:hypothetical protein
MHGRLSENAGSAVLVSSGADGQSKHVASRDMMYEKRWIIYRSMVIMQTSNHATSPSTCTYESDLCLTSFQARIKCMSLYRTSLRYSKL